MNVHPLADLFPMMPDEELQELASHIQANGLIHPIVIKDGQIIDGRNRLAACQLAKVEPKFEELNGRDAAAYIVGANLKRRNLSKGQQAMGLAMVYGMVERHSAELEIDSAPGKGTTVRLVFPLPAAVAEQTGIMAAPGLVTRSLRILLVDDDPLIIESLSETLRNDGHRVTAAEGGQAGIDAFLAAQQRGEPFAAVITDLGMPYIDGRRVAAAVKAAAASTPVVMLTGWGQRLAAENDIPVHVDRVLNKPPKLRELRLVLMDLTAQV